jgi:hypothetical protein
MDLGNKIERNSYADEKIACNTMQRGVNTSILHHKDEKGIAKIFHIKIHIKKFKVDDLFESCTQSNLIK